MQRAVICLMVLWVGIFTRTEAQDLEWDAPVLPVQEGRVILPIACEGKQALHWDEGIESVVFGLVEGDVVWALTKSGKVEAKLGELSCFEGECRGDFAAIDLELSEARPEQVIAVSRVGLFEEGVELFPAEEYLSPTDTGCEDLYREIELSPFPEEKDARACAILRLDDRDTFRMARKGFRQENGWVVHVVKGIVSPSSRLGSAQLVNIDSDTQPLEPILMIDGGTKGRRILWRKAAGICCPSKVTHRWSRIDAGGRFIFGREFTAGGQPCD